MSNDRYVMKIQDDFEKAAIEAFMAKNGVTKCPPVLAKGSELKDSRCKEYSSKTQQWRKDHKGWKKNKVKVKA